MPDLAALDTFTAARFYLAAARVFTKVKIATKIDFDDTCSAQSTLLQVITQDRPGLLYKMCSQISKHGCNIEIALIETEGQMAIDVLYLTANGTKLECNRQDDLRRALVTELEAK